MDAWRVRLIETFTNVQEDSMNIRLVPIAAASLLAACAGPTIAPPATDAPGTTYEITVLREWSETTHPADWPGLAAHFTGAIGATHDGGYALFGDGRIATPGLETLSQRGKTSPFDRELAAAQGSGAVGAVFALEPIRWPRASSTVIVTATDAHPYVSFAMMLAPSPDWFTGVASLPLKRDGRWIELDTVTLYAWDSGTSAAKTYKAEKIAVSPFEPTAINRSPIFVKDGRPVPVGTVTIRKVG
jgi:hypothetical protein